MGKFDHNPNVVILGDGGGSIAKTTLYTIRNEIVNFHETKVLEGDISKPAVE